MTVAATMTRKLTERFAPDPPRHRRRFGAPRRPAGHPGGAGQGGETHFTVTLVSAVFAGHGPRRAAAAGLRDLAAELKGGVHALALTTLAPGEERRLTVRLYVLRYHNT